MSTYFIGLSLNEISMLSPAIAVLRVPTEGPPPQRALYTLLVTHFQMLLS